MTKSIYPYLPILIVDDEPIALESLDFVLQSEGMNNTIQCSDPCEVMGMLSECEIGIILLDLLMPKLSGEEVLSMVAENYPEIPVIIITGVNELQTAVRCMRSKAYDYLVKPLDENQLMTSVTRAAKHREMQMEILLLKQRMFSDTLNNPEAFSKIVTRSKNMFSIFQYIEAIAKSNQSVLITGETGAGKDLIAEAVHSCSGRKGNYVALNIAGLDDTVFSDTMFGHVKGAFTDAKMMREGLVKKAAGGTLFLDEIGDISHESQVKLLRLIQEHEYFPLGSDVPKRTDVRIVAATNRDLKKQAESGKFRNDLYYRLNSHHIHLPPLRRRLEDMPFLLDHFLRMAAQEFGKKKPTPPSELLMLLSAYHFPGNIRELKAMVWDAIALHKSKMLNMDIFRKYIKQNIQGIESPLQQNDQKGVISVSSWKRLPTVKEITTMLIIEALKRSDNNKSIAAQMLGISRQTLVKHVKEDDE
ncbi:MAG: sigma-54-dependent Fis family transcriptional regulator [Desulfobacterales bacterium]|nr:sigma-54-dependent Fis family transcriptional regulator [Desulfobacterales bacterium]